MKDERKTKKQLINELAEMRQRLAELEASETERKRAEEKIRLLSQFQESVIDNANVWLDVLDEKANVVIWNKAAQEISGYSHEEIVGHSKIWEWLYPDEEYRHEITAKAAAIIERGEVVEDFETTIRCKDGQTRIISWNSRNLMDEKGNPIGSIALGRDITERKRAEAVTREWKNRYEAAVLASGHLLYDWNSETNEVTYGGNIKGILGYTPEEIEGGLSRWIELIHPEDQSYFKKTIEHLIATNEPAHLEYRVRKKDGECIIVEDNGHFITDAQGSRTRMVGFVKDITERKRAEEALRESEERYRIVSEIISDWAYADRIEPNGEIVPEWTTGAFTRITGFRPDEAQARDWLDFVHPDDHPIIHERTPALLSGKPQVCEYRFITKSGETLWLRDHTRPVWDEAQGRVVRVYGATQDITERKRAEEALEQRAAQLALLNDISEKVAAVLELDSVLDRAAHLVQESFGYHHVALFTMDREQGEVVMRSRAGAFTTLFPSGHRLKLGQGIVGWVGCHGQTLLANDVDAEPRYVNLYPDVIPTQSELSVPIRVGKEVVGVLDIQSPQLDAFDENDVMVMETLADQVAVAIENARLYEKTQQELTERKRAEEALKEYSERLEEMVEERTKELRKAQEELIRREKLAVLGQLAGGVGHELRNPLGAIKNAVYFLNMVLEQPEADVRETLQILEWEVDNCDHIIGSLLDFARPRTPTLRKVDLRRVIEEALARQAVPEHITVGTQFDEALPIIMADPDQLGLVFGNILRNAVQAMPEGGRLEIVAGPTLRQVHPEPLGFARDKLRRRAQDTAEEGVVVAFSDTGMGIPPEDLVQIFQPLFTTKAKGIGLGLAVSKMLVEGHGGSIEVESPSVSPFDPSTGLRTGLAQDELRTGEVGQGSTFRVFLPLAGVRPAPGSW